MHRLLSIWLILASVALSGVETAHAQEYQDWTFTSGLDPVWQGHGLATADYDGDGHLDVYIASRLKHDPFNPRSWNRLFRNNGDGTFTETTDQAGVRVDHLPDLPVKIFGNKMGVAWGDYDRDGDPDLFLTHVGPEILYRNNGDGTFTDVSATAGINGPDAETDEAETSGASWFDYNLDGYLDLYVSSWTGRNRFYHNNGDGTFTDLAPSLSLDLEDRTWMSMSWDVDGDGWPDLYLANDFGANKLYRNLGNGSFQDITEAWGLGDDGESMGLALGDVSGDGLSDLFITNNPIRGNGTMLNTFFLGSDQLPLSDAASVYGVENTDWAWGTEFADADLDGDLDLFVVNGALIQQNTPNRLFRNMLIEEGRLRLEDISVPSGMAGRAESHGLLLFDANDDGGLDIVVTNWGEPLYFLGHPGPTFRWLKVDLLDETGNPDGVGAEIHLQSPSGSQIRYHNGVDFLGQNVQPAHFGLGLDASYDAVEVTWPSGVRERFPGGSSDQTVTLERGKGTLVSTSTETFYSSSPSLGIYPVPAVDRLNVSAPSGRWVLSDMMGRVVLKGDSRTGDEGPMTLDISHLQSGMYSLLWTDNRSGVRASRLVPIVR